MEYNQTRQRQISGCESGVWSPYNWLEYPPNQAFVRLNKQMAKTESKDQNIVLEECFEFKVIYSFM
jgi:hypothetical protein